VALSPGVRHAAAAQQRRRCLRHHRRINQPHHSVSLSPALAGGATRCGVAAMAAGGDEGSSGLKKSPDFVPDGPWTVEASRGVTFPQGFEAAGISASLRSSPGRPDLALVYCPGGAAAASGVYTKNLVCAAPVTWSKNLTDDAEKRRNITSVLINAGQANAATGEDGWKDAVGSAESLAAALGVPAESILLQSTGVIGQRIKIGAMLAALPDLAAALATSDEAATAAATAITTTDLVYKSTALELALPGFGGKKVRLGGMTKGSGMIHPNMATMLGVVTCDADVDPALWQKMLKHAVEESFNQITVDGDTSTNDTVVALCSGKVPGVKITEEGSPDAQLLQDALTALCQGLGKSIAWDGEGANVLLAVRVEGAGSREDARTIAKSIASSSLAKSAIFGQDPNWGRIAAAAGYAGPHFDVNALDIDLGDTQLMAKGQPLSFDAEKASAYLKDQIGKRGVVDIYVKVGQGPGSGTAWGCDLSYDYVRINAEYTT